jgi:cobalt-zinc-cadmium efflux system membrane fusion protein
VKSLNKFWLLIPLALASSCGSKHTEPPKDSAVISDSLVKNAETALVTSEDETDVIKLNGKVEPDETKLAKVYALVSGKILSVNVELGDYVTKGRVLAVLNSTEVAGLSNDLALAEGNLALAKKSLQTTKDLYEGKLATQQDYISAQISYNRAQSELNRAREVIAIAGGQNATYTLTAPISGYVIEKNITSNSAVRADNSSDLFAIADLSKVWVTANVYESDMTAINLGDHVVINTLAQPDKDYDGRIDKIYNVLDPTTRTMKVRVTMDNTNGELKPEMFATVKVHQRPTGKTLAIPSKAILMDNSRNYVVVRNGNKLEVREINLIKRTDDKAYIASGLNLGDQVVTSGQVFFYQALTKQ